MTSTAPAVVLRTAGSTQLPRRPVSRDLIATGSPFHTFAGRRAVATVSTGQPLRQVAAVHQILVPR